MFVPYEYHVEKLSAKRFVIFYHVAAAAARVGGVLFTVQNHLSKMNRGEQSSHRPRRTRPRRHYVLNPALHRAQLGP